VLALLVLRANEVVGNDWLAHEVWGEQRPANASGALYNHISRLRKELGSDVLVTKPWGYVLRVDPDAVDLHRFNALVAEASSLPARERAAKLAQALALWRGRALADLADEPALSLEAERLDELRLAAVEQRIDAELELGSHNSLIGELEALVGAYPLRERMRGQLILALYRAGRQAEALEVYRETRRVLVEELGIEPTPELRELEQAILRQDDSLALPAAVPVVHDARPPSEKRSFLFLALLVPLFAAGVAFAVVALTRNDAAPVAHETTTATIAALLPETVTTEATTTVTPQQTTTHKRRPEPKAKPETVVRTATVAPATRPVTATTQQQATRKAVTTVPKTTASPRWAWVAADAFDDGAYTSKMWHPGESGDGLSTLANGGRLEMQIRSDAGAPFAQWYEEPCIMIDDFDAQVDYQLLDWPAADGVDVVLGAHVGGSPSDEEALWSAHRSGARGGGGESYVGAVRSSANAVGTEDLSGTLRLVRAKGVLTAYYRGKHGWVRLASGRETRFISLVLTMRTSADAFGRQTARVAFDNFRATAGNMFCPGPYYATRKLVTP